MGSYGFIKPIQVDQQLRALLMETGPASAGSVVLSRSGGGLFTIVKICCEMYRLLHLNTERVQKQGEILHQSAFLAGFSSLDGFFKDFRDSITLFKSVG
jgi:hypothetical protein